MDDTLKHISRIENFLSMALTGGGVSDNIYVGNLPAAIDKGIDDMVYIDVFKAYDYDSHAAASVNVFLYARPTGSSLRKNVKVLDKMEAALTECIKSIGNGGHYAPLIVYRDSGYDDDRNFHYDVMNLKIIIH